MSDVTSNECIAGTGYILERSVLQVSKWKHCINVQYLYDTANIKISEKDWELNDVVMV